MEKKDQNGDGGHTCFYLYANWPVSQKCIIKSEHWAMEKKEVATVRKDDAGTAKQAESISEAINDNRDGCCLALEAYKKLYDSLKDFGQNEQTPIQRYDYIKARIHDCTVSLNRIGSFNYK